MAARYEYIQVHMNRDDAFEWFGGTADGKYLVASNTGDDSFDWTFGWTGRAQFLAVHQRSDDGDWAIEADNNEFANDLLPRSNPQIYNFTSCGDPDSNEGAEAFRAILFRRGTAVTFRNFLVLGSRTLGLQIDGASTLAQVNNGTTQIGAGVIFGPATPAARQRAAVRRQRSLPGRARQRRPRCRRLLRARESELPAVVGGDAGGWAAGADSAAQRRLLRARDLHRRGAAGPGRQLDERLDVVPAAVVSSSIPRPIAGAAPERGPGIPVPSPE